MLYEVITRRRRNRIPRVVAEPQSLEQFVQSGQRVVTGNIGHRVLNAGIRLRRNHVVIREGKPRPIEARVHTGEERVDPQREVPAVTRALERVPAAFDIV